MPTVRTLSAVRPFAAAVALALAATACGSGGTDDTGAAASGSDGGETLADFVPGMDSFDFTDPAAETAAFRRREQQAQELVRQCMAEHGFEYIPYMPDIDLTDDPVGDREYLETHGFGLATELLVDPEEQADDFDQYLDDDPNQAIVAAMDEAERQAYETALYGEQPEITPDMTEEEIDALFENYQPSGCLDDAYAEVYDFDAARDFETEFGPLLEEIFSAAENDPRITELDERWSACMEDAGYEFSSFDEPEVYIARQLEAIGLVTDLEVGPDGAMVGFGMQPLAPDDPRRPQVQAIADEEIAIALAADDCAEDLYEVYVEVQQEYEQRFIDENRAALERFRDEHSTD